MKINEDIIKGKWMEIKGEIQKAWGKVTSDELEQTQGDMKSIAGLIMQKYGENSENFKAKLASILEPFHAKKDEVMDNVKKGLKS